MNREGSCAASYTYQWFIQCIINGMFITFLTTFRITYVKASRTIIFLYKGNNFPTNEECAKVEKFDSSIFSMPTMWLEKDGEFAVDVDSLLEDFSWKIKKNNNKVIQERK